MNVIELERSLRQLRLGGIGAVLETLVVSHTLLTVEIENSAA